MKKRFRRYFLNKYSIIILIVIVIGGYFYFRSRGVAVKPESALATIGNVIERVSVTGKVSPISKADLAFEKSGVLTVVNVKVGDKVKKGDVLASLDSASDQANLQSAEAKLADMSRSLRPEELGVEQAKLNSVGSSLESSRQDALNAARTGYIQAMTAITNSIDSLFENPQTVNPNIKIQVQSSDQKNIIDYERITVTETFNRWKADLNAATSTTSAGILIGNALNYSNAIKSFLNDLSVQVNYLNPGNSGMSQSQIDTDVAIMNTGLSGLNQAISSITTAQAALTAATSAYNEAKNNYLLKNAGNSPEAIASQKATVDSYRAALVKNQLISPIDGLVTRVDPSVGEFVAAGSSGFSVQSEYGYKIEAYVPEADIAKIALNNSASTTLDAYGQYVDFPALVTTVDPAETVLEGVPTYKVTLQFTNHDPRVRSGMTANLEILTHEQDHVLTVPTRAIVDENGRKSIRILNSDSLTFHSVPVTVGLKGSDGNTEIISGLKSGDKVVTYVK